MKIISTDSAPAAIGPYSQGIESHGLVFFSGQIALTPEGNFVEGGIQPQTQQVLNNISALLQAANLEKNQVVKSTIFLTDINDFQLVNTLYGEFFGDHKPARSTIEVSQLPKGAVVEIEIVAAR